MAFADLGSLGATGSTGNNQTTLDLVTTAAIAAGDFVVVVVAADNIANGGDDNACSGVTLGVGGQALTKGIQIANALAAQAGASCSIWYGVASGALALGGTIRASFGSATLVDASGLTARKFSVGAGNTISVEGTPGTLVGNTAADPAALDVTTTNIACLRVRGIASQVGNNTNLTPTASWTAWANGNSATTGTTGEICARAESIISTATGASSNPTYVSAIYASTYIAFKETIAARTATLNLTEAADTISSTSTVLVGGALNSTEANDTISATATVILNATLSVTEANDTLSSAGTVSNPTVTGTLAVTEANDTLAATGTVVYPTVTGTLNVTEANDMLSSVGGPIVGGTLNVTETNDTVSSTATVILNATLSVTEANDTLSSAGTVGWSAVTGTLIVTEVNDNISSTGGPVARGTLSVTEANDTVSSTASVVVRGTLSATEANDTISASGGPVARGILGVAEANDTVSATATVVVRGTLNATEANDTLSATASVIAVISGALNATEANDALSASGVVVLPDALEASLVVDGDVFTITNTLSINYIVHSAINIEEIIPPAVVTQHTFNPPLYLSDDFFGGSILSSDQALAPTLFVSTDTVYSSVIFDPDHAQLYIDTDILIPPFITRLRGVRGSVGVVRGDTSVVTMQGTIGAITMRGLIDPANNLMGHRDG